MDEQFIKLSQVVGSLISFAAVGVFTIGMISQNCPANFQRSHWT